MTTAPLVWVHPHRCFVRHPIQRGEIRRMAHPCVVDAAFAYDLGCPACGCRNTWLVRAPGAAPIVEGALVEVRPPVADEEDRYDDATLRPWPRPTFLATARAAPCVGCKRVLTVGDGVLAVA